MLFPPLSESVISDASATEPRFNVKLYKSVNVPTVAGLNEFPKVPDAGGVMGALTAGAGDKMIGAAIAPVELKAMAVAVAAVNSNLCIATSVTHRSRLIAQLQC